MKIADEIISYFAKSAMDPMFKIDRIDDIVIQKKVSIFLNSIPLEEYEEIFDSEKWKFHYGDNFSDEKAKRIWLIANLGKSIEEKRLNSLLESNSIKPHPHDLMFFNEFDMDENGLINLTDIFNNARYPGQSFPIQNMKFVICQSIGGTNSSYWLAKCLKTLMSDGHIIYGRLDPLLYNDQNKFEDMEYYMQVWGKDLQWEKLKNLRDEEHGQWIPDLLGCSSSLRTDYIWNPSGHEIHLTIEELPKRELIRTRGSRYFHAIFDKKKNSFIHCDGAVRIYDNIDIDKRVKYHLKQSEVRKIGTRSKIFDIKTEISIGEFISVCCNFFVWNTDVQRYMADSIGNHT